MKIVLSIAVAILTFLTVFIATICDRKWYKISISLMMSILVTVLVYNTYTWL